MAARVSLAIEKGHFRAGERVGVAVSGGADSVGLLLAMHLANHEMRSGKAVGLGIGLSAMHVHHGLRGADADADAAFVAELCARLGLTLHGKHVDVPARVAAMGESVEEAARNVRYDYFKELIAAGTVGTIATAHTRNDQAETVLMKLLRGAWSEGLSGIHPVVNVPGGKIVRPLLGVERAEIEAFLKAEGQGWREDASNAETVYTRNRVRHALLPRLREENPKLDVTLANLAEVARAEEARWEAELKKLLPQVLLPGLPVRGGGRAVSTVPGQAGVAIEIERLRGMDLALRRRVVRAAAAQLGVELGFEHTVAVLGLCGLDGKEVKGTVHLPGGLRAERSVRELRIYRA